MEAALMVGDMASYQITALQAREILDSRGRPTLETTCRLASGATAAASVPSGASTGTAEALELRDNDPQRYRGLGCRTAVAMVHGELQRVATGQIWSGQAELDQALCLADGTPNKARLGANAILSVSLAFARAVALQQGVTLYQSFADLAGETLRSLPRPTINLFSGGKHAGGQAPLQDVLIVPVAARSMDDSLALAFAVYQAAADLIHERYGMRLLRADEGGLAPPFARPEAMFEDAVAAIERAGLRPGHDICLAVDVAASHFEHNGTYQLYDQHLDSAGMIDRITQWVAAYPVISVEDGLAERDWQHWPLLRRALQGQALTLGDDLLCTNPQRISRAITEQAADALLLKVNQIGTVSEALQSQQLARHAGWAV